MGENERERDNVPEFNVGEGFDEEEEGEEGEADFFRGVVEERGKWAKSFCEGGGRREKRERGEKGKEGKRREKERKREKKKKKEKKREKKEKKREKKKRI